MIYKIFILTGLLFMLASCNNKPTQDKPTQDIPKALEDKTASYEIISKRGNDDLIESLYNELLSKNVSLRELEDNIDALNRSRDDSTNLFNKFNRKNQAYFSDANKHVEVIKDSLLREKIKNLITNKVEKYNSLIVKHSELLKFIEANSLTIADLHNVLKIVKTLPLIEKYQQDNLPSTKSLESYLKLQEEAIKGADKLSK